MPNPKAIPSAKASVSNPLRKAATRVLKPKISAAPSTISQAVASQPTVGIQAAGNQGLILAAYDRKL